METKVMGPTFGTTGIIEKKEGHTERMPFDDGGRDWNDVSKN